MNLIFDLDGTLIDSRLRLYCLFQKLVQQSNLSYESYWKFKRDKVSNEAILTKVFGYDEASISEFVARWMDLIEKPEYIALDKNFPGTHDALERVSQQASLHVCTARQHRHIVIKQLGHLGLLKYFDSVMVTGQSRCKRELIGDVPSLGVKDWIVGDTGKDIQVGQALRINTCGVLSGFLSEKSIKAYNPDLVMPTLTDFCDHFLYVYAHNSEH